MSGRKSVLVSVVIYVIVFIISIYISPWQTEEVTFEKISEFLSDADSNSVCSVKFMFFGIYELIEMFIYAVSGVFMDFKKIAFFFSVCALFTYLHYLSERFIEVISEDADNIVEQVVIKYIYDNIFSYVICIVSYYFFNPVYDKAESMYTSSSSVVVHIAIIIAFAIFIVAPSLLQIVNLGAYLGGIFAVIKALGFISSALEEKPVLLFIALWAVTIICVFVLGLIIKVIMELLYEKGIELKEWFTEGVTELLGLSVELLFWIIKTAVRLFVIGIILFGIYMIFEQFF